MYTDKSLENNIGNTAYSFEFEPSFSQLVIKTCIIVTREETVTLSWPITQLCVRNL